MSDPRLGGVGQDAGNSGTPIMLGDRYRLDEIIGRGGMAEVWRAWDIRLGRDVAVKRLRTDLATDPTFQARFQREAQSAAGLNHPNIVSVYDTGAQIDPATGVDIPYIVMELVQGTTLRDLLRDGRQMLPERALEFTGGVLDALAYAHRHGIVHRDIKPANVMLTTTGRIKVMDFGIARAVSDTSSTMTQTAAVIGTAQYLSPEQARGETVDARSDIYSVGCLLYELLTSRPPFVGDSPVSVAYQHVREQPVPPSRVDPELTPDIDTVVLTALAKNPNARYQSAEAMRADITRLLNGEAPLGAAATPTDGDATRVLSDRPAPGARPRRGFSEVYPAPVDAEAEAATAVMPESEDAGDGTSLLPSGAMDDESPEPTKKRRLSPAVIVLIVLLAALLTAGGIVFYQIMKQPPEPTTAVVPSVLTMTQTDATAAIQNANLSVSVQSEAGDAATKGQVLRQDPQGGQTALIGSSVTIWVNTGPATGVIPDGLVGMSESDARRALANANFTTVPPSQSAPNGTDDPLTLQAGQVMKVNPPSGTTYALDQPVVLTLATGKSAIPNLFGMSQTDASDVAGAPPYGFMVQLADPSTMPVTDGCNVGTVCRQFPAYDPTGANNTAPRFKADGSPNPILIWLGEAPPPPSTEPPTSTEPSTPDTNSPSDLTTPEPSDSATS